MPSTFPLPKYHRIYLALRERLDDGRSGSPRTRLTGLLENMSACA